VMQAREAELEAREAEIASQQVKAAAFWQDLMIQKDALTADRKNLGEREEQLKFRMLRYFGLEEPGPLQSMPSFQQIEADGAAVATLGERDPQYGAGETVVDVHESFAVPPLNLPEGATLTRSSAAQRRSMRRADNPKH